MKVPFLRHVVPPHVFCLLGEGVTADAVYFDLGIQAPIWATGPGAPRDGQHHFNWEPSSSAFASFVRAVGRRYSGSYRPNGASAPLPRVSFWSVWNEPNLGFELAPQSGEEIAARVAAVAATPKTIVDQAQRASTGE